MLSKLLQNRYLIISEIGRGGMGAVYLAKDKQNFGREVAVKQTLFTEEYLLLAFEDEARLLSGLDHRALPKVTHFFIEDNQPFLVMEFIPGDDLATRMERSTEPFTPEEVLDWADQLLDSLVYMHRQRVIHRDIKPRNLKINPGGKLFLLDFGLAKGTPLYATRVKTSRSIRGFTIDYAPPEQIQGRGTEAASDLYSLAATMYHLMTGASPRDAEDRAHAIINNQPDPLRPAHKLNPQVSVTISELLMQAMALNLSQRPATALVMRQALNEARKDKVSPGAPPLKASPAPTLVADRMVTPDSAVTLLDTGTLLERERGEVRQEPPPIAPDATTKIDKPPGPVQRESVGLLAEYPIEGQNAWPLGGKRVLVWEAQAKNLSVWEEDLVEWSDSLSTPLRCISRGPTDQWAVTTWDGQVHCFTGGKLAASTKLDGTVGDIQFHGDRWLAGTWKKSLVSIPLIGEQIQLLNVEMGVFRIAVRADSDWFAAADLSGGIGLYSSNKRVKDLPSLGAVSSLAFAGRRLMVLTKDALIPIELDGHIVSRDPRPGDGNARLLPAPTPNKCLLLSNNGVCRLLNESGIQETYFNFTDERTLLSSCQVLKRFTVRRRPHGCAYLRDGKEHQVWPEAIGANLSADGRLVTVIFPNKVQLYEDSL